MILWGLAIALAAIAVVLVCVLIRLVGRESNERRGMLRFDTPEARAALRDPDDWFSE